MSITSKRAVTELQNVRGGKKKSPTPAHPLDEKTKVCKG